MALNTAADIIEDIRQGKMVILMDDEDRENEGDLIMAAEKVQPQHINFMAKEARGLICLTLTQMRCTQLGLPLMVAESHARHGTNFTLSIEAAQGVTTGISAADRAHTVQVAVAKQAKPSDLVQPGHIFPVMAQPGGVLTRAGHTEAGCDLARLAGLEPASVIVEIMNDDGTMARYPDLEKFAAQHQLKIGTIADLIQYRMQHEKTIVCVDTREVNTLFGPFVLKTYQDRERQDTHYALIKGQVQADQPTLVRVHLGSTARDLLCLWPSDAANKPWTCQAALAKIAAEGQGVLVLIGHAESCDEVRDSIESILAGQPRRANAQLAYKEVGTGSQILQDLGVHKMRLLSAPYRFNAISGFQLEVVEYLVNE